MFAIFLLLTLMPNFAKAEITGGMASQPQNVSIFVMSGPPVINIYSPQNTNYTNTSVLLNYSISNNFSSAWYTLDSSENVSLPNSPNYSTVLTASFGSHVLYLYANNSQGISFSRVDFGVLSQSTQPPSSGSSGGAGGGGGSGGSSSGVTAFDLEKNLLQTSLTQGESKTEIIKIKNVGTSKITVLIETLNLDNFVLIEDKNLTLNVGETKELEARFFALSTFPPGIYFGKIIFTSGSFKESVVSVIDVKQKNALFDVNLEVLPNYKTTSPGKKISTLIDMTNIAFRGTAVDVDLFLKITDLDKKIVYESSKETIAVRDNLSITRQLQLPKDLASGTYFVLGEILYNNVSASSYDTIDVKSNAVSIWIVLLVILAFIVWAFFIWLKVHKNKKKRK